MTVDYSNTAGDRFVEMALLAFKLIDGGKNLDEFARDAHKKMKIAWS
ncbi:hypothetical protein M8C21_032788 [Ambrosia artemisiifolia]|uniref:Uncharacterized protein n=1 Tax=Ambrosia artemisiifolia TaxID=4212 RepID=A0AAD5GRZ8_AMBAR|nr:hypothetical protein M8C21_032788 [Ambrosia artemisiifolia]